MLTGSQRVTTVMELARPGGIRTRMIGTRLTSPMATTTTILLRTTVVVTDRATSDADKSRFALYMPGDRTRGISEMGFPFILPPIPSETPIHDGRTIALMFR